MKNSLKEKITKQLSSREMEIIGQLLIEKWSALFPDQDEYQYKAIGLWHGKLWYPTDKYVLFGLPSANGSLDVVFSKRTLKIK